MSARPRRTAAHAADIARRSAPSTGVRVRSTPRSAEVEPLTEPKAKRARKSVASTATKAAEPSPVSAAVTTTATPAPYRPSLLPPTLTFSLPAAQAHLTAADPRFGLMLAHVPLKPFTPPLRAVDPFRTLVTSIIGQQVSWLAARAIGERFRRLFGYGGEEVPGVKGEEEQDDEDQGGFPSPIEVMSKDALTLKSVGLSMRKAEYVISLAEHFHSGQLSTELLRDGTDEEIAAALIAVRGIGQWTVDMFLMFSLRRPDILPVGDLGVQKGLLRWALAAHGALPRKVKAEAGAGGKMVEARRKKYTKASTTPATPGPQREAIPHVGQSTVETSISTPPPADIEAANRAVAPPTPITPGNAQSTGFTPGEQALRPAELHTPMTPPRAAARDLPVLPPTPLTPAPQPTANRTPPGETLEVPSATLPAPTPDELLYPDNLPSSGPASKQPWDADAAVPLPEELGVDVLKARLAGKKVKGGAYLTPKEMEALTEHWRPFRSLGVYYMWPAGEDF